MKKPKYDFEYSSLSVGVIITASSIRGANRVLNRTVKHPEKFNLLRVIGSDSCEVDLEMVK